LLSEGLPKDSSYCERTFNYELLEAKKKKETVEINSKYTCQTQYGSIPNYQGQCKLLSSIKKDLGDFTQALVTHGNV
jgi:hypothetical protein